MNYKDLTIGTTISISDPMHVDVIYQVSGEIEDLGSGTKAIPVILVDSKQYSDMVMFDYIDINYLEMFPSRWYVVNWEACLYDIDGEELA